MTVPIQPGPLVRVLSYPAPFQWPIPSTAVEKIGNYLYAETPAAASWVALTASAVLGKQGPFIVPALNWGRIHEINFSCSTPGFTIPASKDVRFQLVANGIPIPGYESIYMPYPYDKETGTMTLNLRAFILFQPGSAVTVGVNIWNFIDGGLAGTAALVNVRGWSWSQASDAQYKNGTLNLP